MKQEIEKLRLSCFKTIFLFLVYSIFQFSAFSIEQMQIEPISSAHNVDEYGIPIVLIDEPLKYIQELKNKISSETTYSLHVYQMMEKHYSLLLYLKVNNNEFARNYNIKYTSFYKDLVDKNKDRNLVLSYRLRYIKGLFISRLYEKAITELEKISQSDLEQNLYEKIYYNTLQTYKQVDLDKKKQLYQAVINELTKNAFSTFELGSMYNNYARVIENHNPKEAYQLYLLGLDITQAPILQEFLLSGAYSLAQRDKNLKKTFNRDLLSCVEKMQDNQQKIALLTNILKLEIFKNDSRNQRIIMDVTYAELKKTKNIVLKIEALTRLGLYEYLFRNYVDTYKIWVLCRDYSNSIGWHDRAKLFESYRLSDLAEIGDSAAVQKELVPHAKKIIESDLQSEIKKVEIIPLVKICIELKLWNEYKIIQNLSTEANIWDSICLSLSSDTLTDLCNKRTSYTKSDLKIVFSSIQQNVIDKIPTDKRAFISLHLSDMGDVDLAKIWEPNTIKDFSSKISLAENKMAMHTPDALQQALIILNGISPEPFSVEGVQYTKNDATGLILSDKLCVHTSLGKIENLPEAIRDLECIIPQCSESFTQNYLAVAELNIGVAYAMLGYGGEKVLNLLNKSAERLTKNQEHIYHALLLLAKAKVYSITQNWIMVKQIAQLARDFFRRQQNDFMYAQSSLYLAMALIGLNEEYHQISSVLDESVHIGKKSGNEDILFQTYLVYMHAIFTDKKTSYSEKIKKFNVIRQQCLKHNFSNPWLLAGFFSISAKLQYDNNFPHQSTIEDIEKYFHYQKLFSVAISDGTLLHKRDLMMKNMLLELLEETGNAKKIDYWNKIFEKERIRSHNIKSSAKIESNTNLLSLLDLVTKFENAKQILLEEECKQESVRDKTLIQKALILKREIEHQFEQRRKNLSQKDSKILDNILADNFIIHPDSLVQFCTILPADTACIQFLPVGENIIVYIATHNSTPFMTSISLKDNSSSAKLLQIKLTKLRNLIQNKNSEIIIKKELQEMYFILFSELEEPLMRFHVTKILVNASGFLRYMPFVALYDGKKYLVEKYQISNITGLDLIRLSKSRPSRNSEEIKAAIFADPDGSLPSGRSEGQNIAQFFANKKLYLGDKASLTEFESMVGNVNFVHLATHAVLDPNEPGKSYIQFADGKKWYYSDMMGFNIRNVDSIALSACETAVSEKSTGGEIEGMAYQLLKKSPSGSVLASFWKVDDTATAMLMGIYYKHVTDSIKTNHTLDRGGALREAQLNLLKNPDTSHPYYWAAFTLFGDFR